MSTKKSVLTGELLKEIRSIMTSRRSTSRRKSTSRAKKISAAIARLRKLSHKKKTSRSTSRNKTATKKRRTASRKKKTGPFSVSHAVHTAAGHREVAAARTEAKTAMQKKIEERLKALSAKPQGVKQSLQDILNIPDAD